MDALFHDVRFAVRALIKNRRFSLVAIAALALGIGANAAIFKALGIALLRGRTFRDRDVAGGAAVMIVNDAFAKKYWPNADPIGQQVTIGKGLGHEFEDPTREVVGVVASVREDGLSHQPPAIVYVPTAQMSDALTRLTNSLIPAPWIVRTSGITVALTATIQQEFLAVDAQLPVSRVRPMYVVVGTSIQQQDFDMLLLSIFGGIALVLAAIGIYGLMSYSVEQGTRDIGVRLALGAERGAILRMVVRRGMTLATIAWCRSRSHRTRVPDSGMGCRP